MRRRIVTLLASMPLLMGFATAASANELSQQQERITLSPSHEINEVGSEHEVTATVLDAEGNPQPDVPVNFEVSGRNDGTGTDETDASGEATFAYNDGGSTDEPGDDSISACFTEGGTVQEIAFRAAASGGNANTSTLTIDGPAGVVQDDSLVAQVTVRGGTAATITAPAGWTLLSRQNNGTTLAQAVYHRVATSSEPATYTWTFDGNRRASGGIIAYSGVDAANPIDASGGQTGSGSEVTAPSIVTTAADAMLVGFFGIAHTATFTPPTGMTERYDVSSTTGGEPVRTSSAGADENVAMPGPTGLRTATATQSDPWVGHSVALRPAVEEAETFCDTVTKRWAVPGVAAQISLEPGEATNPVGGDHELTATVTDEFDNPVEGEDVNFTVTSEGSPDPDTDTAATDANGEAAFTYTNTVAGEDTIDACFGEGDAETCDTATKTWTAGSAQNITLEPAEDTNTVGEPHELTATVTDEFDNPVEGEAVDFVVDGRNVNSGTATTDDNGEATFTYTDTGPTDQDGEDAITATLRSDPTVTDTATKTWVERVATGISLEPADDTNTVGEDHEVTAIVIDQFGDPVEGEAVHFEVDDEGTPDPASGDEVTNANGQASFTFTNNTVGAVNGITGCIDADANEACDDGEPSSDPAATKTWEGIIVTCGGFDVEKHPDQIHRETHPEVDGEIIVGTEGGDVIDGTDDGDVICGLGGNDTINGLGGADIIFGGPGDDIIRGGGGDDVIRGNGGDDTLMGGAGHDILRGSAGNDILRGGSGRDTVLGEGGRDVLGGGGGKDVLRGGGGNDRLFANAGNDTLLGGRGRDVLEGGRGRDTLRGGPGADILRGGGGNDRLFGDAGNDVLNGGPGSDLCVGGPGNDTFRRCERVRR
jgi:Ca2+-binding RTX toxin-like protein